MRVYASRECTEAVSQRRRSAQGIVVGVGALMCAIGSWFAHKFYKGEKLPFELLAPPSAAEEAAMLSGGKANVPITPDVAYTGKG